MFYSSSPHGKNALVWRRDFCLQHRTYFKTFTDTFCTQLRCEFLPITSYALEHCKVVQLKLVSDGLFWLCVNPNIPKSMRFKWCKSKSHVFPVTYHEEYVHKHIYIYIIHYIPIGQSQTRICPTWSSNISYISFAKSCIGHLADTVQYRIYWTVSKRGYGHSAHVVPTHQISVNVLNENIINITPFAENIDVFA